ncbi:hypothetical protein [Nocardioides sp. CER19]|uniref:hypothetical protein n=1 Tax=Nocardioides sp. CER19 TaxID=3038538 RepID=UPI00244BD4B6|nr:hypothetical protein [Nocardioides sp. CER19]MDH2415023.1 hypothetical protein [Nocardioides sp. CER19]
MRQLRHLIAVIAVLAGAVSLTACGSDDDAAPASSQTTKRIDIKFEGNSVSPSGERVDVAIGQPIEFVVTADAPGEVHVHSDPEKELEYEKGTTILDLGPFDKAGIIEVESHHLEKTIVQLEVK